MTDSISGSTSGPGTGPDDRDGAALGRLFTDLADDPDAPTSSVSALSVIAAAQGGGRAAGSTATAVVPAGRAAEVESTDRPSPPDQASVGELHGLSAQQDAERRARRRRTTVLAGLAAACVVAVAAVVIPITLSNSGGTTTSAGSAADNSAARAPSAAAGGAVPPAGSEGSAGSEAPAQPEATGQAQGEASAAASATINPANPDANRPPPGENALTQTVPVPGGPAPTEGSDTGGGVTTSCWPALSDAAAGALVGSLPAGAFGAPGLLGLGCPAGPVAGASLTGTTPETQLVVRVTRAEPGACAQSASETGAKCVARGGDQYVANDSGNLSVYAYGNGYEVEVGGRPATGIAPIPSGLTADQLSAAAAAVLATLG